MASRERYVDLDPPPPGSPKLFHDLDSVEDSRPSAQLRPRKLTVGQTDRLRRDLAIYQAVEGGMSLRMAGKVFGLTYEGIRKAHLRILSRKSRV